MCPDACSFPCLEALYLLFFLIKKVTKRIKAILPHMRDSAGFAIAHAQVPELVVRSISEVDIFSLHGLSLHRQRKEMHIKRKNAALTPPH